MSDGLVLYKIDTRDLRAAADIVERSRVRINDQDHLPVRTNGVQNISYLSPYKSSSNTREIYENALRAVNEYVAPTAVMAGQYGLSISALAQTDRPDVVTINIGHGNFLSNNTFAFNGYLDIESRAALTYVASLVSQIRKSNPSASIVLMGAYNGGTLANLASILTGLPAITMIATPLRPEVVEAGELFYQELSRLNPDLVPPEVANNPVESAKFRTDITPFQTVPVDSYIYESVLPWGTESYAYDASKLRLLKPFLEKLEGLIGPGKVFTRVNEGLQGVFEEFLHAAGEEVAQASVEGLIDAMVRGDHDAAYEIAGGNERALEWISNWSVAEFVDDALVQNQADLPSLLDATGGLNFLFEPTGEPIGLTTEQIRSIARQLMWGPGPTPSYYTLEDDLIGLLRGALRQDPEVINKLVDEDGFGSVVSIGPGASFLKDASLYGRFNAKLLAGLRIGPDNETITRVIGHAQGGERFDNLLWQYTDYLRRERGVEPTRQDIIELYSEVIGVYDNQGGEQGLREFLAEVLNLQFREALFGRAADAAFGREGNSPGARPLDDTCFVAGTRILLASGETRQVEHLAVGDAVFCFDEASPFGGLTQGTVTGVVKRLSSRIVTLNALSCTHDHKILNAEGTFQPADSFKLGDVVIDESGAQVPIETYEIKDSKQAVYAVTMAPHATLVADGIRVHNEAKCSIYEQFFRVDDNLSIKSDIRPDGSLIMEYIDGRGVKLGERIISDRFTLERIYEEYGDLTGFELRDDDGVFRPKLPPGQIEEIYNFEVEGYKSAERFGSFGSALGSLLGDRIAGNDVALGIALKSTLGTVLENAFEVASIGHAWGELPLTELEILGNVELEFAGNLAGAVSSYLIGELFAEIGIGGVPGEVLQTSAGAVVSSISQNIIAGVGAFDGLGVSFGNSIGSFIGSRLASEIVSFDSVGGQIGSSLGASAGSIFGPQLIAAIFPKLLGSLGWAGGPVGAAIGAFVGFLLGGLIGSVFGGTPRSGADVVWDEGSRQFAVKNIYARKGGSKETAKAISANIAESLNSVVSTLGGFLENPAAVQTGNYGMRGKDLVYRPYSTDDKDAITAKFRGKDAFANLLTYGLKNALTDDDFRILGGSVIAKRAFYNYMDSVSAGTEAFDQAELFGNIASAASYESVFANAEALLAIGSVSGDSVEARELAISLARGHELGLDRRARSDWFGGFELLQQSSGVHYADFSFELSVDSSSSQYVRELTYGEYLLPEMIANGSQHRVVGGSANDVIDARGGSIASIVGLQVDGVLQDDVAVAGTDFQHLATQVAFASTATRAQATLSVVQDGLQERTETYLLEASSAQDLFIVDRRAEVKIVDAGGPAHLTVGNSYVSTIDNHLVFRVVLSKALGEQVEVALVATDAEGQALDLTLELSENGVDGWQHADTIAFAPGSREYFVRVPVAEVAPARAADPADRVRGTAAELRLEATVVEGSALLAEESTSATGYGRVIEDGDVPRNFAWIDPLVIHEEIATAVASIARSRLGATGQIFLTTQDRSSLTIGISGSYEGGGGADTIYTSDLGDNALGGNGDDVIYGGRLDDWLLGGDGNDRLDSGTALTSAPGGDGNYLDGGAGNDQLFGREGADWLEGGDGSDVLRADKESDVLAGGAGEGDALYGGSGDDSYLVRRGDGADIVEDEDSAAPAAPAVGDAIRQRILGIKSGLIKRDWSGRNTPGVTNGRIDGGEDAIVFGQEIGVGDVMLKRDPINPNNLLILIMATDSQTGNVLASGTQLTIKDWFSNPFKRIEWLKFTDGTEVRIADITSFVAGGSGNDVLIGTLGNDFVFGGAGDDTLYLLAGDDVGNGSTANDFLAGDAGRDLMIGGLGDDRLMGGRGADAMSGDAGQDDLYGGADNDIISGGLGTDFLAGGAGDDVFKFNRGDGADTIVDELAGTWAVAWQASGSAAGQWLNGYGQNAATGEVFDPNGNLVRQNVGTSANPDFRWVGRVDYDSLTQTLKHLVPPSGGGASVINANATAAGDSIELAPGILIQDIIHRRSGNDLVLHIAPAGADPASALAITDSITLKDWFLAPATIERLVFYSTGELDLTSTSIVPGTDADDTALDGGSGTDWITGGAGEDTIGGGSGDDILSGDSGADDIAGGLGADVLFGGSGDDVLTGGSGADTLVGGAGSDTASYEGALGVTASLANPGSNQGDAAGDEYDSVENLSGGSAADDLTGDDGENILTGAGGNDQLQGLEGDDTYSWDVGDGSDTIHEGVYDVEEVLRADGTLADGYTSSAASYPDHFYGLPAFNNVLTIVRDGGVVYEWSDYTSQPYANDPKTWPAAGWVAGFGPTGNGYQVASSSFDADEDAGVDTLELGSGVGLSDLGFVWSGTDLAINVGGASPATLTLEAQATVGGRVEVLQLDDGLSANLANLVLNADGGVEDDFVVGDASANQLDGGDGHDVISGGAGDDLLAGGTGDDVIEGGAGADQISGGANSDPTEQGWGDTARYAGSAAGVSIDLTTALQTGGDAEGDSLSGIENVTGSDAGADLLQGDGSGNRLLGLGGDDTLAGRAGDDVLSGGEGGDELDGGDGDDALDGGAGNDTLEGGAGIDVLSGGDGADLIDAGDGEDSLQGGAGDDTLDGGLHDDVLSGGDGNDWLRAGDGDDQVIGDAGNDLLEGAGGNDTYVFDSASGNDTVVDTTGVNTIMFAGGIDPSRLWLTRAGDDLKIAVIGGTASISVTGFFLEGAPAGKLQRIEAGGHSLFVNHPDVQALIGAMTTASSSLPSAMPAGMETLLASAWDEGLLAAPRAPAEPQRIEISSGAPVYAGANLVDLADWPVGSAPSGQASLIGWANDSDLVDEARWASVQGPDGTPVIAMEVGQADASPEGGGNTSNAVSIDGAKAYEFTYFFRFTETGVHDLRLGLADAAYVESADTGEAATSPYFLEIPAAEQAGFTEGRWYKAVAYVLAEGAAPATVAELGGVFDVQSGQRVAEIAQNFRWSAERPDDEVRSRMFVSGGEATQGYSAQLYQPAMHELDGFAGALIDASLGVVDHDSAELTYSLDPQGGPSKGSLVLVDALTGEVRYTPALGASGDDSFSVLATDADGKQTVVPIVLALTPAGINRAPVVPAGGFALAHAENAAVGVIVGVIAASDPDRPSSELDYSFTGSQVSEVGGRFVSVSADGRYSLDRDSGELKLLVAGSDFETDSAFAYAITVRDSNSGVLAASTSTWLAVSLGDVNEPHSLASKSVDIREFGVALGPLVPVPDALGRAINLQTLMLSDPEQDQMRWSFAPGTPAGPWSLSPDGTLYAMGATNYNVASSYTLTVQARDEALGLTRSATLTINMQDVPDDGYFDASGTSSGGTGGSYYGTLGGIRDANGNLLSESDLAALYIARQITEGADTIFGTKYADVVVARGGNDQILSSAGNDVLAGNGGDDTYAFDLGGGADRIREYIGGVGGGGFDTVLAGYGISSSNLTVSQASGGRDLVIGVSGSNAQVTFERTLVDSNYHIERLVFDNGTQLSAADLFARTIVATAGNDKFTGSYEGEVMSGAGGDDVLDARDGADSVSGGDGNDQLTGGGANDSLVGGAGNDTLVGDSIVRPSFNLLVNGGFETASGPITSYSWGIGTTAIPGWTRANTAQFELVNSGHASVYATEGSRWLDLDAATPDGIANLYISQTVTGLIAGEELQLSFDAANRMSAGSGNFEVLWNGVVVMSVTDGQHTAMKNYGLTLTAAEGDNVVAFRGLGPADGGGASLDNAQLRSFSPLGGNGNDTLEGGLGNDTLIGGGGDDTYLFARGDGQDVLREFGGDYQFGGGGSDILTFAAGIAPSEVVVAQGDGGRDLVLTITGTTDRITLDDATINTNGNLEQVRFADGTIWSFADLLQKAAPATTGNDTLTGTDSAQLMTGSAGNDTLQALKGNDVLIGGLGNDLLIGGVHDDTYVFYLGDGQDIVRDNSGAVTSPGWDTLVFGPGITSGGITVAQQASGGDLLISINGTTDSVLLNWDINYPDYRIDRVLFADGTSLTHGELLALAIMPTSGDDVFYGSYDDEPLLGGAGNDTLYGRSGNDTLTGGTGNDLVIGGLHDDTYVFNLGDGQDIVRDNPGAVTSPGWDTLEFGAGITAGGITVTSLATGTDLLITINGTTDSLLLDDDINNYDNRIDRVLFADGTLLTHGDLLTLANAPTSGDDVFYGSYDDEPLLGGAGNDTLHGRNGNDRLTGGLGNDLLIGGLHDDTYVFNLGDGQDIVRDNSGAVTSPGWDTLEFGAGIAVGGITVTQQAGGTDVLITINGTTDSVLLDDDINNSDYRIDRVLFTDGTSLTHAQLLALSMASNSGSEVFYGSYDADTLLGGTGNDTLYGRNGNDTLTGGAGNDFLVGGLHDDTYVFNLGDGQDTISDNTSNVTSAGYDTLQFGTGITVGGITVTQQASGGDLLIAINGTTDSVLLSWDINYSDYRIDRVQFADGTTLTHAELLSMSMVSNSGNDVFYGSYDNETLAGGAGDDTMLARAGNDILVGGVGNDTVSGGAGDDTYLFNLGDGQDIVRDYWSSGEPGSGNDTLQFGAGILASDVTVTQVDAGNDFVLTIRGRSDQVTLDQAVTSANYKIEKVTFFDGTIWDGATLLAKSYVGVAGTASADHQLAGANARADLLTALAGDDTLFGLSGNDLLDAGSGNDTVDAGDGNDSLAGGDGNDTLKGALGDDVIDGGAGDDLLLGDGRTNLVFNGSFEDRGSTSGDVTQAWGIQTSDLPGWTRANTQVFELVLAGTQGVAVPHGAYNLDMTSGTGTAGKMNISQQITSLSAGQALALSFNMARSAAGTGANLQVLWNGAVVADYTSVSTTPAIVNLNLTAIAGTNTLGFKTTTGPDTHGVYIDQVQLFNAAAETGGNDTLSGGDGVDRLEGGGGNDRLDAGNGNDTALGEDGNDWIQGGSGDDLIEGGTGDDSLNGDGLVNLILNGSFEDHGAATGDTSFAWGKQTADMAGWARINPRSFEALGSGSGVTPSDGTYALDMTAGTGTDGKMVVSQVLTSLASGQNLTLTFDAARSIAAGGAALQVFWNGTLVQEYSSIAATMGTLSLNLVAQAGANTLTFKSAGGPDEAGVVLDNVQLYGTASLTGGNDRLVGGAGNDLLTGGAGTDVAVFAGARETYTITTSGGSILVTDTNATEDGNDGTDTLSVVEVAEFKGGIQESLAAPIVLDLDGDGIELVGSTISKVRFDWNGDGFADRTGWIGRGDGLLVYDRDGNGTVSGFGELSFTDDKLGARSDLDGLSAFDTDHDGVLSSSDGDWSQFHIWSDANQNGSVDRGEFLTPEQAGVVSINLAGTPTSRTWGWGENIVVNEGTFARTDGSSGAFADAALSYAASAQGDGTDRSALSRSGGIAEQASARNGRPRTHKQRLLFDELDERGETARGNLGAGLASDILQSSEEPAFRIAQLARMVQDMASFGARSGEMEPRHLIDSIQFTEFHA
jgi:Ca2+-binding RTX toxin-like protein